MKWIYNIPAAIYQLHNGKSVSISSWFSKNHYSFCQSPLTISISFCHWFTHLCTHTDTHTHTCIHISTARCLVLRVLLPVTKSLVSDITHKSLLINSSPGTKLAFGHGRCSCSFFTAGQVRRLLMAASLPFLFCSLSLSVFLPLSSLFPTPLTPQASTTFIQPAQPCFAGINLLASVSPVSKPE